MSDESYNDTLKVINDAITFGTQGKYGATVGDDRKLEQLREAGLDHLQVSLLDTEPESNDRLAGAASFVIGGFVAIFGGWRRRLRRRRRRRLRTRR